MTPGEKIALVTAATALLAAIFGEFRTRRAERNRAAEAKRQLDAEDRKADLAAREAGFENAMKLQEYVDGRVAKALEPYERALTASTERETRRTRAMSRILRAIADQLPPGLRLRLPPDDLAELEDTIPSQLLDLTKEIP